MGNSIELNGKRYDARTGKIISDTSDTPVVAAKPRPLPTPGAVDGFVRRSGQVQALAPVSSHHKPKPAVALTTPKHTSRSVQKAQTLMRPAVKKPDQIKNDVQATKRVAKPSDQHAVRHARAEASQKSPHISKFAHSFGSSVVKKTEALPVVMPTHATAVNAKANAELQKIEQALQNATSHLHTLEKGTIKKARFLERVGFRNKLANIGAMSAAFLLLAGFFGYQNSPAIEMRLAATRSGVDAKIPDYKPSGYGISRGIKADSGKVVMNFSSRTDDKQFTVTQQTSEWNSASLLANHVTKTRCNTCYQTWQNNGKTVYIYDNSNATWVTGGVWYQVEGNASLTSDQLLRLANSF